MNPVVIDTNCLLQIISRKSPYRPIWDAFLAGRYTLCAFNEILDEYQEILEQQISQTVAENVVMLILNQENVQLVDPHFRMGIITADPDGIESIQNSKFRIQSEEIWYDLSGKPAKALTKKGSGKGAILVTKGRKVHR